MKNTRSTAIALLEDLVRTGNEDAVVVLVEPLIKRCRASHAVFDLAIAAKRYDLAGQVAEDLGTWDLDQLLERAWLPGEVIDVLGTKRARTQMIATQLARRSDLTENTAARLARQSNRSVQRTLRSNWALPASVAWKVRDELQDRIAGARWTAKRAEGLATEVLEEQLTVVASTGGVSDESLSVFRAAVSILPNQLSTKSTIGELLSRCVDAGLSDGAALAGWVRRGGRGVAIVATIEHLERGSEGQSGRWVATGSSHTEVERRLLESVGDYASRPGARWRWNDDATLNRAAESSVAHIRGAALGHRDKAAEAELWLEGQLEAWLEDSNSSVSIAAISGTWGALANPALSRGLVVRLAGVIGEAGHSLVEAENLEDEDRMAILEGPAGPSLARYMSTAIGEARRPAWVAAWWKPELIAKTIEVSVDPQAQSRLLETAVNTWPEQAYELVAGVTMSSQIGAVLATQLVAALGQLTAGQAEVAAVMLSDWDEPLTALFDVARSLGD